MPQDDPLRILLTDPIHPIGISLLEAEGFLVSKGYDIPKGELARHIAPYHALVCRTSTPITDALLQAAINLRSVCVSSTGFDHVDLGAATKRNIAVLGLSPSNQEIHPLKDGNFISTAEHTILLILSVLRKLHEAHLSMKAGRWEKHALMGEELYGKTVGVVGLGRIGKLVAERLQNFGARVQWYDPYVQEASLDRPLGIKMESLDELCRTSDIITLHVRKTPETTHLFDERRLGLLKTTAVLINTSRASVIDEAALFQALEGQRLGHAALDVFHDEPHGVNQKLIQLPNVTATPHIGGSTHAAQERIARNTAAFLIGYLKNGERDHLLNDLP